MSEKHDIYNELLDSRIVWLNSEVDSDSAGDVITRLLYLASKSTDPISLYIQSPGGEVMAGLGIIDTMRAISAPVHTIVVGYACSMAFMLASSGAKGGRAALKHSRLMAHSLSGGVHGTLEQMQKSFHESVELDAILRKVLKENTGLADKVIKKLFACDNWMSPLEAMKLNVIDKVIVKI